jgi:hypothetical protein
MPTRAPWKNRTRSPSVRTSTVEAPCEPPLPDRVLEDLSTLDCLTNLAVCHIEDAASEDPVARRRHARLLGLLAEHAQRAFDVAMGSTKRNLGPRPTVDSGKPHTPD